MRSKKPLPKHRYEEINTAQEYLSQCLKEGSLVLALGAGVSSGMGLPSWLQLVSSCCKDAGVKKNFKKKYSNEDLRYAINEVEDCIKKKTNSREQYREEYQKLIHRCLYKNGKVKYDESITTKPLLVAIGALISGSIRGSVNEIITLNFDDVLEWYLDVYGLKAQIVHDLPVLKKNSDVIIYHLHGYVPLDNAKGSSEIFIFSKRSYDKYFAKDLINLQELIWKDLLTSKVVLFIGLSGDDVTFGPIFEDVKKRTEGKQPHHGPIGVWLFGEKPDNHRISELRDWGIAPLILKSHDEYASFIFGVCQKASKL